MKKVMKIEKKIGSQTLVMETGKVARQSHGALTVRYGDTIVLATVLSAPATRQIDYFPLYVDYREMQYAGGKFPGGFFKREGRPSGKEILSCRMIDRTIRPLFPKDFNNEVQIQCMVISADKDNDADILAMIGGSAALALSPAPFLSPIAAVRVGRIDGQFVVFPTYKQRAESDFDLVVAGHRNAINMIELGGNEVDEATVAQACDFAFEHIKTIIDMIEAMVKEAGAAKTYESTPLSEELLGLVADRCGEKLRQAKQINEKAERNQAVAALCDELLAEICPEGVDDPAHSPAAVRKAFYKTEGKIQRELILSGIRPDGRAVDEIRKRTIEVPVLPRTHGSALFTRGETQALAVVTLGTPRDQQKIDGLLPEECFKRFLLHYNFPPFSVGEIRPIRGPGRRDIGHGALAEKSLLPVLPSAEEFPYTVRVVSEILESNGSSSMAAVCGATLSLMDAGVPIKAPVAGISVGMVREGDRKVLLTDIIGEEDFHGDMDFKVAGTRNGITGIQVDVKPVEGIDAETIVQALEQARAARMKLLDDIEEAISVPRKDISTYAPKMLTIKINPEKIGKIIGPGGKTINGMSTKYEVSIDIEDDGTIFIAGVSGDGAEQARAEIESMTEEVTVGKIYTGKVVGIKEFGAFVEIFPGQDGLCHISQLEDRRVETVTDVCDLGDTMDVKVIGIDDRGRIKLSRKDAMKKEEK